MKCAFSENRFEIFPLICGSPYGAHPLGSGVPVAWPEESSDHGPEFRKVGLTLGGVLCGWTESTDQNSLLRGNALLRRKPGSDCGDDGGAVAAGVGGRQGQEGGGEDE